MSEDTLEIKSEYDNLSDEDKVLINETIYDITGILEETAGLAYEKVGNLILSNFFDGDLTIADEIEDKNSTNPKIKLFKILEDEILKKSKVEKLPKKTWLYNSLNLLREEKLLENHSNKPEYVGRVEFTEYGTLCVSHKIEMLSIKDIDDKLKYIRKITAEKLTVQKYRALKRAASTAKTPGLLSYINNPSSIENVDTITLSGGKAKIDSAAKVAEKKINDYSSEIDKKRKELDQLEALLERLKKYTPPPKGRKKSA